MDHGPETEFCCRLGGCRVRSVGSPRSPPVISKVALIGIVRVVPVIQNFADVAQQVLVVLSGLISRVHRDTPFLSLFYTSFRPM